MQRFRSAISSPSNDSGSAVRLVTVAVLACLPLCDCSVLMAQKSIGDRVTLQLEGRSSRITLSCRIEDYTGKTIKIRTNIRSELRTYPASQVVDVQIRQTPSHANAAKLYAAGQIEQAATAFKLALNEELREWVRREILAMLIRCDLRLGNESSAGSWFGALVASDRHTRHFKLIPLIWTTRSISDDLENIARNWISKSDEIHRLMGASILLNDSQYGGVAENTLGELVVSGDRRIQQLANAQQWRKRLRAKDLGDEELKRWETRIESMEESLRGGPYYVLGTARMRRREYERAATALLWVPLVYDHNPLLSSRACLEAADALLQFGQKTEAITLYREVKGRFAETPYAQEAASVLKELVEKTDDN